MRDRVSPIPNCIGAVAALTLPIIGPLLAPHLTKDNVDKLISDCAGMKRRQVEEYVVAFRPKPVFEPSIRKRPAPPSISPAPPPPPVAVETPKSSLTILQPARSEIFNFRFSANRDFKDKFERLAEVVGVENAQKHMSEILENALEKKDPKKRLERRRKSKRGATAPSRSNEIAKKDEPAESRYVAAEVVERIHERDAYQCIYRGRDGRRCTARAGLHIDHSDPFGIYHSNEESILRLLCGAHNGLEAERVYGADFIRRKIDERRKARSP